MRTRALLFALLAGLGSVLFMGTAHAETKLSEPAEDCIKAVEKTNNVDSCQEAPNPILPATNELLWGGLSFLVLFGLFSWKGYPAVKKAMDARTAAIQGSLDEAEGAKVEATSVLAEYQRQLADAKTESARIIEEARAQAETVKRDLIARAEAEAAELRQRNAEAIAGERDRVMGELQGQVASLAIELAEKVVGANLDRDTNTRLIENYISSVGTR